MRRRIAKLALTLLALALLALLGWQCRNERLSTPSDSPDPRGRHADATGQLAPVDRSAPTRRASDDGIVANPHVHPQDAQCARERRAQYEALYRSIDPQASPDAAALRALLVPTLGLGPAASLIAERELTAASDRWPKDIELAWLAYERCGGTSGCNPQVRLAHLQDADGDNMFAWLPSLTQASHDGDNKELAQALSLAARAPLYDSRTGTIALRLRPALQALPLPEVCMTSPGLLELARTTGRTADAMLHADMQSMAMEHAFATPGFQGLLRSCRPSMTPTPGKILENCRRVLSRVAEGDTLLEQLVALPTLIDLAPDQASRETWRERYRRLRWLQTFGEEIGSIDGFLWRTFSEGEIAVLEQHARDTGRWPPPADWVPDDERSRAVLGEGPR